MNGTQKEDETMGYVRSMSVARGWRAVLLGSLVLIASLAWLAGSSRWTAAEARAVAPENAGSVVAWGNNDQGQIIVPGGLGSVRAIAGGMFHSLALKNDGTVAAWGFNASGQTNVPFGLGGVTDIAGGGAHSLARKSDGTVVGWGANQFGQATLPGGTGSVMAIAAGYEHSLAIVDTTAPAAVDLFDADAGEGRVSLSWSNPSAPDFLAVRVLRSTTGPATSPQPDASQAKVYEGSAESFTDTGLANGTTYYYTIYARDDAGNFSPRAREIATPMEADITVPDAPVITSPANDSFDRDGSFVVRGTAEAGSMVRLYEGTARVGTGEADPTTGEWAVGLVDAGEATHTYKAKATDASGNVSGDSGAVTVIVDKTAPAVLATTPAGKNVTRTANVTATFSEAMSRTSVESAGTVKLVKKGTTRAVAAVVTYDPATKKAMLNPNNGLTGGATYVATVSTGAKDSAGNALAAGKAWSFAVRR